MTFLIELSLSQQAGSGKRGNGEGFREVNGAVPYLSGLMEQERFTLGLGLCWICLAFAKAQQSTQGGCVRVPRRGQSWSSCKDTARVSALTSRSRPGCFSALGVA